MENTVEYANMLPVGINRSGKVTFRYKLMENPYGRDEKYLVLADVIGNGYRFEGCTIGVIYGSPSNHRYEEAMEMYRDKMKELQCKRYSSQ